jgi:dihydrodipicolinate synthase/N-acetylneuraminate lyase
MNLSLPSAVHEALQRGVAIPAMPLALTSARTLDERRQRALCRYYAAAGAGGLAVAVHTTQFEIREPKHGLLEPVLALASEEITRADGVRPVPMVRVAGLCGGTAQAVAEAELAVGLGYHAGLLSLAALRGSDVATCLAHCRAVARVIPIVGFYLQRAVGGPDLPYRFWREFAEIERVVAIKIAPFDRYRTLDVVRAVVETGRDDIALYTGNDDNIVIDLLTAYRFKTAGAEVERRIVGGLLGHWSVWTQRAVELLKACQYASAQANVVPRELLRMAVEVTDANAAFFDTANGFAGCIAGLHEVLRRQGLLEGIWTLDPREGLSPGQFEEIDRVYRSYPHLNDDEFVAQHRDDWLRS